MPAPALAAVGENAAVDETMPAPEEGIDENIGGEEVEDEAEAASDVSDISGDIDESEEIEEEPAAEPLAESIEETVAETGEESVEALEITISAVEGYNEGGYHLGDIAVINGLIDNNGLDLPKWTTGDAPPAEWERNGLLDNGRLIEWIASEQGYRVTSLNFSQCGLTGKVDLTGLTALTRLGCIWNSITELDVSKNIALEQLYLGATSLTRLNLSNNTALVELSIDDSNLTELDLSGLTALQNLGCSNNDNLTALDLSGLTALTALTCNNNIGLTSLNLGRLTALEWMHCMGNDLTELGLSGLTALTTLDCSGNNLTELDLSGLTVLTNLDCSGNNLTELNLSGLTALTNLYCRNNNLAGLNVSNNNALNKLYCDDNNLTALDVSGLTALTNLVCDNNDLTALDVSALTALTELVCYNNNLTALDISGLTELFSLSCFGNNLSALNVSNNTALGRLECDNNDLTELDMSGAPALFELRCYDNNLTLLDLSANTALRWLYCDNNNFSSLRLPGGSTMYFEVAPAEIGNISLVFNTNYLDDNFENRRGLVSATPNNGYVFDSWECAGFTSEPYGDNPLYFTLPATGDVTITAKFNATVTQKAISGITAPAKGEIPVSAITETEQYTGTVAWSPALDEDGRFKVGTVYTATITLAPKAGYTLEGVAANFFTVAGATNVINQANSGIVTAVFPIPITDPAIPGVKPPVTHEAPATSLDAPQYTGTIIWSPALSEGRFAPGLTYTATIALTPKAGYTLAGVPANFFTVAGAASATNAADSGLVTAVFPATAFATATALTLSPSYAILLPGETARLVAALEPAWADPSLVAWSADADSVSLSPASGLATTVTTKGDISEKTVVQVTATYRQGRIQYSRSATIELLPAGTKMEAELLETKATINRALAEGALVPIRATRAFSEVKVAAPGFAGKPYGSDARFIEITADETAKTTKGVAVSVKIGEAWVEAGKLDLTVVDRLPKVAVTAEPLNLFWPGKGAKVTATAEDGTEIAVESLAPPENAKWTVVYEDGMVWLGEGVAKAGTYRVTALCSDLRYDEPLVATLALRVINSKPKLKLAVRTAVLAYDEEPGDGGDALIGLLSGDSKTALADWGEIARVTLGKGGKIREDDIELAYDEESGTIRIPADLLYDEERERYKSSGSFRVRVWFDGSNEDQPAGPLSLTVKSAKRGSVKASSKTKSLLVNTRHEGQVATAAIQLSAHNLRISDWYLATVNGKEDLGLPGLGVEVGENRLTFAVTDKEALADALIDERGRAAASKTFRLVFNSEEMNNKTPIRISLTVTDKAVSGRVSAKGRLDIANPLSELAATVRLANTASVIAEGGVKLDNEDYIVSEISGSTFKVKVAEGRRPVPGVKSTVKATVALVNGIDDLECTFAVTPAQTVGRASQSKKAVTLYKESPFLGEEIALSLASPANAKLGEVEIASDIFALERSGENSWVISFKDGKAPQGAKKSYPVKLRLWAEGTYAKDQEGSPVKDADGSIAPLRSGKKVSKPTVVNVTVNVN
jgi:hypothetical protein